MKIAIYGREFSNAALPYVQQVFDSLMQFEIEPFLYDKFSQFISGKIYHDHCGNGKATQGIKGNKPAGLQGHTIKLDN